jgi:hypothetical protein
MISPKMDVEFRVCVETQPQEVVCVVGDNKKLGEWLPYQAQKLRRLQSKDLWPGEEG